MLLTDVLQNPSQEITGQTVSTPLCQQPNETSNQQPPTHSRRAHKFLPARLSTVQLHFQRLLDLYILGLDEFRLSVALSVIFGQDVEGFFSASMSNEPSRGLGHEENKGDLKGGRDELQKGWNTPAPIATHVEGA